MSLVGSSADLRVMRSVVNSSGSIPAYWIADGLEVLKPSGRDRRYRYKRNPGHCNITVEGYNVFRHRLGYGQEHQLFISRKPGFLLVASDEAVWQELKSDRITTPIIREWLPYIASRLRAKSLLTECEVYPFEHELPELLRPHDYEPGLRPHAPVLNSAVFAATSKSVDDIVVDGLRTKAIAIPSEKPSESDDTRVDKGPGWAGKDRCMVVDETIQEKLE